MLVLTRKKGERVMIGDDIVVTIIDVRGDGVRIGFDAPRGVSIQRAEVLAAVSAANTAAANLDASDGELLRGMFGGGAGAARIDAPTADGAAADAADAPDSADAASHGGSTPDAASPPADAPRPAAD